MTEFIELNNTKEIREWMEANPRRGTLRGLTLQELINSVEIKKEVPKDGNYYGIKHTYDGPDITLGQVYIAKDAKEALQQYLFAPNTHQAGVGEECISFKLRDNFWYEPQQIRVFKLAEGTDSFY
ncbi:hypothetical protein ACFLW0_02465 [Chloroflexota bacterium]